MTSRRFPTTVAALCALTLLAGACGGDSASDEPSAAGSTESSGTSEGTSTSELQQAVVAVNDQAITINGDLEASPTEVQISSDAADKSFVFFGRLNEGITEDKLLEAVGDDPNAAFGLVTAAGGAELEPGATSTLTVEFPVGEYIVVNPDAFGEVTPAFFTVTDPMETIEEPPADWALEVGDFYFEIGEGIAGGTIRFVITNAGKQSHEVIIQSKDDKKASAFAIAPAPGGAVWTEFELTPGEYTAVCYFPDPRSGKPHVKLGMKQDFTIT